MKCEMIDLPTNHLRSGGGFPKRLAHFTATLCPFGVVKFCPLPTTDPFNSICGAFGATVTIIRVKNETFRIMNGLNY